MKSDRTATSPNFHTARKLIAATVMVLGVGFAVPLSAGEAPDGTAWAEKAEAVAREFVLANAQQLANSIQRIAHPRGRRPELMNLDVSRVGDHLLVRIAIGWSTTSTRRSFASWVYWEFGEQGHMRAQIVSHTAPAKITAKTAALLEEHFREKIYPAVIRGVGPSELN